MKTPHQKELEKARYLRYRSKPEAREKAAASFQRRYSNKDYRDLQSKKAKEYNRQHPEKSKARYQLVRQNPDLIKKRIASSIAWNQSHWGTVLEASKRWRDRNLETARENARRWRRNHPEKVKAYKSARRAATARVVINPESITFFIATIRKKALVKCYYCGNDTPGKKIHFDHVIPLAKGGSHSVGNLCAACPQCNHQKHAKMIKDWMRLGQQILSL